MHLALIMSGNQSKTIDQALPDQDEALSMRSDLRRLVVLERLQTALGIGLLLAIAARAVATAEDDAVGSALVIVGMLAMIVVTVALRARLGHASLRRDVQALELRRDLESRPEPDAASFDLQGSAYRGRFFPPIRAAVARLRRTDRKRRKLRGSRMRDSVRHLHAREHCLRRR